MGTLELGEICRVLTSGFNADQKTAGQEYRRTGRQLRVFSYMAETILVDGIIGG